jgi:hypothetical protein
MMARPEVFKKLERPPVLFDHLRHVETLKVEGCSVCHKPDAQGRIVYQFYDPKKMLDGRELIDAYHDKCMVCHDGDAETVKDAKSAKALGCGECHSETAEYKPVEWYQAAFDHYRHINEMEQGCGTCHHVYDEQQKKLVYNKGDETSCGGCHKDTDDAKAESLRKVGHTSCIGCHVEKSLAAETKMDPYSCKGCHRPEAKPAPIEPRALVAHAYQQNPTTLLISYPGSILPGVPFDHEKHAKPNEPDTCTKSCHQFHVRTLAGFDPLFLKTGDACRQCHAQSDVTKSVDAMTVDKVYHAKDSDSSCVGCHTKKVEQDKTLQAPVTCKECHKAETPTEPVRMAEPVSEDKGPESFVIARLTRKYMPVTFPHATHTKMIERCDYCHHHGPEKERPTCAACHGAPLDFTKLTRPRLLSAYHRMCMGCHKNMGIGPVTCTKCHEERETTYALGQRMRMSTAPIEGENTAVPESL